MTRVAGAVLALMLVLGGCVRGYAASNDTEAEREIFRLVNKERTSRGLPALAYDERLASAARVHSALMAKNHEIAHQFNHEPMVAIRLGETGLHFSRSGENVATAGDADSAHDALMHSPGHRANILRPEFDSIGVGVVRDGVQIYVTQDFALRTADLSVANAERSVAEKFNQLRAKAGAGELPVKVSETMRQGACEMAKEDSLDANAFGRAGKFATPNAQNIVVYTAADILELPDNLTRLARAPGGGLSIGICYARSASYPNPVYWVAVVIRSKDTQGMTR